ncbi:DUF1264-domain-containing protein [Eremomyces bilateralis CBS 781.70]|uniref:DUF1264-domain-containing protein n=1 Tax=Eremomyces bilateralis CBS 781.70 TaxID=1392243 RepID=A0A6G1GAP0_9PEZI|nr:DUF1264-domain-containing protein [Eremomyces bilateralis CBS 781.70]KAF1814909.1 DUF1264-domain-containing protein [Eremomyces bilateralis CBS 781.70]
MENTSTVAGDPLSTKSTVLDSAANLTQSKGPVNSICAHLNAFHVYADDTGRFVEANHYCSHLNEDVRQCILYDSPEPNARLIGIEYMISPKLYQTLDPDERKLWHSHIYEVKSGMLIMPRPRGMPEIAWETAETKEMEDVIVLYGKIYHLWQTDRGDQLPLGPPKLMTSFTGPDQFDFDKNVGERDQRFGSDYRKQKQAREYIPEPEIHPDADQAWKK